jgi:hypothetical protein
MQLAQQVGSLGIAAEARANENKKIISQCQYASYFNAQILA